MQAGPHFSGINVEAEVSLRRILMMPMHTMWHTCHRQTERSKVCGHFRFSTTLADYCVITDKTEVISISSDGHDGSKEVSQSSMTMDLTIKEEPFAYRVLADGTIDLTDE